VSDVNIYILILSHNWMASVKFVLCFIDLLVLLVDTLFLFMILYSDTVRSNEI